MAATAGVSRPTLYRWFPSKEALLEAFGVYEQQKYDAGIAAAVAGLEGEARLDAILRFIVEFQHTYSLRRIVDVEPEHVVLPDDPGHADHARPASPALPGT